MTLNDATQLHERIVRHVLQSNLKDAFSSLGYLMQQNGFGKAYDKLVEIENKYRYMLRYRLEGFPDPDREKVQQAIRRQMLDIADESYQQWMIRNSPEYYYDRVRVERANGQESLANLLESLKETGEKLTMAQLLEDKDARETKWSQLIRIRERTTIRLFYRILTSDSWTESKVEQMRALFADPALFDYEKGLFVSALLLGLQKRMDALSIQFLLELTGHQETEVSQRALVAAVLVLYLYDERMELYPEIGTKLSVMSEADPTLQDALVRVFYQLIRSKDTDAVTKRMQEEILPEMTKMGSALQDKIRDGEDIGDDFNPEWKNMMENSDFSVKMQQFSDMQLEGIDVYMSTFSTQKGYSFFGEFAHWFLPFYPSHSTLEELFGNNPLEGVSVLDAVLKSDYLCSSDKYSFCYNLLQVPASYRSSMSSQLGADSEMYEEVQKNNLGMNGRFRLEQASNRYIQDLYRFFNLHHRKKDFINVFALPLDFHNTKTLSAFVQNENALRRIGMLYFKNKHFGHALMVLDRLLTLRPADAELHQKRGYCLQQLNQPALALAAYQQADLIQSDSLWTLKRMATACRLMKQHAQALEYYRRAEALAPEDIPLALNIGHALVDSGDYAEALNAYFKVEVLTEGSSKTWRPIAWCSFMCRKYEQAQRYYELLLPQSTVLEDFLNAGHVQWCMGSPMKAIELYKKGIRVTHTALPEFLDAFHKDTNVLLQHGVFSEDIPALRDELIYELEE